MSDAEEEADEGPRAMRGGGGGAGGAAGAGAYEDDGDAAGPGWGAGWSAASRTRTGGGADDNSLLSKLGGAALMVEEVGDVEVVGTQVKAAKAAKERVSVPGPEMLGLKGRQVNAQTAAQLRTLLFGDAVKMFNDAWKQQVSDACCCVLGTPPVCCPLLTAPLRSASRASSSRIPRTLATASCRWREDHVVCWPLSM